MISCKKGVCSIEGNNIEIEADLTVLIHAIDGAFSDKFGKDEAYKSVKRCFDLAMETRDVKPDKVEDNGKVIDDYIVQKLKNLDELLNKIINAADDGK